MERRRTILLACASAAVAAVLLFALFQYPGYLVHSGPAARSPGWPPTVTDLTPALGPVFHPGVILAGGSNDSATLIGGIGVYTLHPEFSLPVLASVQLGPHGAFTTNLTAEVDSEFFAGGVYGIGWNGSAWLIAGQAGWGGGNDGSMVSYAHGIFQNLTSLIFPYFAGGGIFALGWNGTAWLIGGNSTAGTIVVGVAGDTVTNYTPRMSTYDKLGWIQTIHWNGTAWLIGGQGVLGTLHQGQYTDLWKVSPFGRSGVYGGDWNGTAWLAGGGAGRLCTLTGTAFRAIPPLTVRFNQAALLIVAVPGGWVVGGKGLSATGVVTPELFVWNASLAPAQSADVSSLVPSSFTSGEIQGGVPAPWLGPSTILLVGDGNYDFTTGYGFGAVAALTLHPAG